MKEHVWSSMVLLGIAGAALAFESYAVAVVVFGIVFVHIIDGATKEIVKAINKRPR